MSSLVKPLSFISDKEMPVREQLMHKGLGEEATWNTAAAALRFMLLSWAALNHH